MKKVALVAIALMIAAPAMAAVTLSTAVDNAAKKVTVSYNDTGVAGTTKARAFALKIYTNNTAKITSLTSATANANGAGYGIYPGKIKINDTTGAVTDYNSPVELNNVNGVGGASALNSTQVIVAMGSLYQAGTSGPAASGELFSFVVDGATTVTIEPEIAVRGGVIGEDANALTVAAVQATITAAPPECLKNTDPGYAFWAANGKPNCWCFKKQCNGDINGTSSFGKPVSTADLNVMKLAFNKNDAELLAIGSGICADLNHAASFGKRVSTADLNTLKNYFNDNEVDVPVCAMTHINFYTN